MSPAARASSCGGSGGDRPPRSVGARRTAHRGREWAAAGTRAVARQDAERRSYPLLKGKTDVRPARPAPSGLPSSDALAANPRTTPRGRPARRQTADAVTFRAMCRNIRPLYNFEPPATHDEVHDAAVQFVRKVSGFTKPAKANEEAFERAVQEISAATTRLLDSLVTNAPPKDREVEAEKRRARSAERYAA